jgi:hypothetical protein
MRARISFEVELPENLLPGEIDYLHRRLGDGSSAMAQVFLRARREGARRSYLVQPVVIKDSIEVSVDEEHVS